MNSWRLRKELVFCLVAIFFSISVYMLMTSSRIRNAQVRKCKLISRKVEFIGKWGEEQRVTVWDCGDCGILVSLDWDVFRFAKEQSDLKISKDKYIVGIE